MSKRTPTNWQQKPFRSAEWDDALASLAGWLVIFGLNSALISYGNSAGYPFSWLQVLALAIPFAFCAYYVHKMWRHRELKHFTITGAPPEEKAE